MLGEAKDGCCPKTAIPAKPLVTIGLCVKNFEKYISDTMASLIAQDFPPELIELIVVDGYSTDTTLSIIKKYISKIGMRYKVFYENKGLGFARQIVVDNAQTEYIVWVDGDLVLSEEYIKGLFSLMSQNSRLGIVKGKYSLESGANRVATLEIYARAATKLVDFNSKINTNSMGTAGCMYRVEAIRQAGGFEAGIKGYGEDWDAERRVAAKGWYLGIFDVCYRDYERYGLTWKDVWRKYLRRGRDSLRFFHMNRGSIELYRWTPFAGFVSGLLHSSIIYRLTGKKIAFLLPIQYAFKQSAWCFGFLQEKLDSSEISQAIERR